MLGMDPLELALLAIGFIVGITFHEAAHAWVAYRLGDSTPKEQGRITLKPWRHLDFFGTFMMVVAGFGWGRPVMVDQSQFRGDQRRADALVSIAGPATNLAIAVVLGLLLRFVDVPAVLAFPLYVVVIVNLILAFFNLIPVPPLDGFSVVAGLLPAEVGRPLGSLRKYGAVFLLLIAMGSRSGGTSLGSLIDPLVDGSLDVLLGPPV